MSETDTGVLLATDLGVRCDRATARALRLARAFGGAAVAASAVEPAQARAREVAAPEAPDWYRPAEPLAQAERRLRQEVAGGDAGWEVRVAEGSAGEHLAGILDGMDGEAVAVTGPVRDGVLGPAILGSTVDRLLRRAGTTLLIVRARVHADYRHLLVASDFSEPARLALQRACALFPQARITVLHGFTIPRLGLMDKTQDAVVADTAAQLQDEARAFLRDAGVEDDVDLVIEPGDPARLAQQYVESFAPDLVVVGTHGRGAVYELVVGSIARRIVTTVEADTLVVRR